MRRILTILLFSVGASVATADGSPAQLVVDATWQAVSDRCPSEAAAFPHAGQLAYAELVVGELLVNGEFPAGSGLKEFIGQWMDQGRPYVPAFHALSFMAVGKVQMGNISRLQARLKSGLVGDTTAAETASLLTESRASTALFRCIQPNNDEAAQFRETTNEVAEVVVEIMDSLDCENWLEFSDAVLTLDVAKAGTQEMNDRLQAIRDDVLGTCEGNS